MKINKKGFTLVELLTAVSILGIITIIALPQISKLMQENNETKYKKYEEAIITAGKLYTDSYNKDIFYYNKNGCYDIKYDELKSNNLIKDINIDGTDCSGENTFVRVIKTNNNYKYSIAIECKNNRKTVHKKELSEVICEGRYDKTPPQISIEPNGTTD